MLKASAKDVTVVKELPSVRASTSASAPSVLTFPSEERGTMLLLKLKQMSRIRKPKNHHLIQRATKELLKREVKGIERSRKKETGIVNSIVNVLMGKKRKHK